MDKSVLDLEEILGPRDEQLLQKLSAHEPAILDEVVDYYLSRVGCTTTDPAATRLLSVAVQVAFEKAIDEAKLILASSRGEASVVSRRTDRGSSTQLRPMQSKCSLVEESSASPTGACSTFEEVGTAGGLLMEYRVPGSCVAAVFTVMFPAVCGYMIGLRASALGNPFYAIMRCPATVCRSKFSQVKELDVESLCKALQRNGTLPVGPAFDLLLQPLAQENGALGS